MTAADLPAEKIAALAEVITEVRDTAPRLPTDADSGDIAGALAPLIAGWLGEAWSQGHAAGRDYQGDGWNSDAHDPEDDNPYRGGER